MAACDQDFGFNLFDEFRILFKENASLVAALTKPRFSVAEPGTALLDNSIIDSHVDQVADQTDSASAQHVELSDSERRGDLIFDNLRLHPDSDGFLTIFQRGDATNIDSGLAVEFQRATARSRFRTAKHHADFLPNLVDEDNGGL